MRTIEDLRTWAGDDKMKQAMFALHDRVESPPEVQPAPAPTPQPFASGNALASALGARPPTAPADSSK
ncbi:MAG TPA: hypothetical protein VER17_01620 [Tepidisphaeraceae bacterium]|nr:hypothetical protein [Tepidisphaeraceae bacterium]